MSNTHGRDFGEPVTLNDLMRELAPVIDRGDVDAMCEVIDRLLLFGAWGFILDPDGERYAPHPGELKLLNKDLRGAIVAAYRHGRRVERERLRAALSTGDYLPV
jgi:hypothetical protein